MDSRKSLGNQQRGSMAVTAIVALVVLMVIVLGLATAGLGVLRSGSHSARVRGLNNLSASGIQYGYWQYAYNYVSLPYTTTRNFGTGKFTVTVQDNSANVAGTIFINSTATINNETLTTNHVYASIFQPTYAVSSGSGASGYFTADNYYVGGSTYSQGTTVNTSAVSRPAPQSVYQSERYGNYTYTFPGLSVLTAYKVRLHFAEIYWNGSGMRVFNVKINGVQVLTNFDIYVAAGNASWTAVIKEFTVTSDASGKIAIQMITVVDNAKTSGVEIVPLS